MLTQEELPDITDRLLRVVMSAASPRQALAAGLYPDLRERLGEGEPRVLVEAALRLCHDDGYRLAPPAMVRLLRTLLPDEPPVVLIVQRLLVPPPAQDDPFEALVLVSKLPFLDRHSTRAALRLFLQPTPTQPVVVVNGPAESDKSYGKSYTAEFVDHVLAARADVQHCVIQLPEGQGASTGPRELARDLVTGLGGDPERVPPPDTNLDRWAKDLANWVISVANSSPSNWWFLLDGFNARELRPDTQLLITKLALLLLTGAARRRHRLVLADFDRSLLPIRPGMIAPETTVPIPHASVRAAVADVVSRSPQPLDVAAVTSTILAGLDDPIAELPELGFRLGDLIAGIDGGALAGRQP